MKPTIFKVLIQEVLTEIFSESVNLNELKQDSNISILFQDNKIELKKIKHGFKVTALTNPERIKESDILKFLDFNIWIGSKPKCYIYRKNEIEKYKKIKMVHEFSEVKKIEIE